MSVATEAPGSGSRGAVAGGRVPAWAFACAALFACAWGGNQFTPLLTLYRSADGWSAVVVDALLGAYVLGLAPALLVGGRFSDRHGRRRVVLAALVASIAGSACLATGSLTGVAAGRMLSGVGVGLAMAVGTSWATELTVAAGAAPAAGARRASLWLTGGFGLGAGVAGVLAQWGPAPEALPYLCHIVLGAAVLAGVARRSVDVPPPAPLPGGRAGILGPSLRSPRFRSRVLPMAPWVFGSAAVAYAILPQAMASHVGHGKLLYATLLTVATLGCGVLVQPLARRLDRPGRPLAIRVAMVLVVVGIAVAAAAVVAGDPVVAAAAAVTLGGAYGIALVAGLLEVQRMAGPGELASLTGVYYSLTYVGFLLPAALAAVGGWVGTGTELGVLAVVAAACGLVAGRRRP